MRRLCQKICTHQQRFATAPELVDIDASEVISELARKVGGGGPPDFAQDGGPDVEALDSTLEDVPEVLEQK